MRSVPGVLPVYLFLSRILWSSSPVIEVQGSKMFVDPKGLSKNYIKTFQAYVISGGPEDLTIEIFKKVVKEGDVVLDLGANIGFYTLLATRLAGPKGKVYAFEPEPTNFRLLSKNLELNGYDNVVAMQNAVSNTAGTVKFFLDNKDTGAHTMYKSDEDKKSIEVETVVLDEFFKDKKHPINFIKMDVEGAELAALAGMDRIIKENKDLKMIMEFYPHAIERAGNRPEEFARKLLEEYRFKIQAIGEYTKERKYLDINNVDELMKLCRGGRTANLFMERE